MLICIFLPALNNEAQMFEFFDGKLVELTPTSVVIDVGGTGYSLNISLNTFSRLSGLKEARVYAHLVVREDVHELFGFFHKAERDYFRLLISVSGVGPNTARMVLSALETNELRRAIQTNDINSIKAVKGIGPKTAQRIIIDLADKIGKSEPFSDVMAKKDNTKRDEAFTALLVLGFSRPTVEKVIDALMARDGDLPVEELIKRALKLL